VFEGSQGRVKKGWGSQERVGEKLAGEPVEGGNRGGKRVVGVQYWGIQVEGGKIEEKQVEVEKTIQGLLGENAGGKKKQVRGSQKK